MRPEPFRLQVPDQALADLKARLARTRFPDEPPLEPWATGTSLAYLKELVGYWQSGFDWRRQEARLNGFRQYRVPIRGIDVHFIHEPGRGSSPMPLLLMHGWPGSVWEFNRLIPLSPNASRSSRPHCPGFTLSFRPGQRALRVEEMADILPSWRASSATSVWRAGRRLGRASSRRAWATRTRAASWDPPTTCRAGDRPRRIRDWSRQLALMKEESGYISIQDKAPDARLWFERLAGGTRRLDRREISAAERSAHQPRRRDEHFALLVHRAIGSSFWPYYARTPWMADPRRRDGGCAPATPNSRRRCGRRARSRRRPTPDRARTPAAGRPLRRPGAARSPAEEVERSSGGTTLFY
jgi:microsomal epoxide hydrolase